MSQNYDFYGCVKSDAERESYDNARDFARDVYYCLTYNCCFQRHYVILWSSTIRTRDVFYELFFCCANVSRHLLARSAIKSPSQERAFMADFLQSRIISNSASEHPISGDIKLFYFLMIFSVPQFRVNHFH